MFVKEGRQIIIDHLTGYLGLTSGLTARLAKTLPSGAIEDWYNGGMTEATFGGYAGQSLGASPAATINGSNQGESLSPTITWSASGSFSPETIYVVYITALQADSTQRMLFAFELDTPVIVNSDGDTVQRVIDLLSDNLT